MDIIMTGNTQHLCINDTLDLIISKEGLNYTVQVLEIPNLKCKVINYEQYQELQA